MYNKVINPGKKKSYFLQVAKKKKKKKRKEILNQKCLLDKSIPEVSNQKYFCTKLNLLIPW